MTYVVVLGRGATSTGDRVPPPASEAALIDIESA
jgi:hypothetical protein